MKDNSHPGNSLKLANKDTIKQQNCNPHPVKNGENLKVDAVVFCSISRIFTLKYFGSI
jgi:hypothetical protein